MDDQRLGYRLGQISVKGRRLIASPPVFRIVVGFSLAGEQGFEPQLPDPESGVLPLDDSPERVGESSMGQESCSTLSAHLLGVLAGSISGSCA